jgi:phage tail-like protein
MNGDERLYALLPAFYRNRDAEQGQPLRALLSVMESRYAAVHADVQALYDAWFVETCPERLLPRLAELVGVEGMDDPARIFPTTRSAVGNAVGYARRKGTAWVLARALRDATGWPARVVEPLEDVGSTQALAEVRPGREGTVSLRRPLPGAASPDAPAPTADLRISSAPREQFGAGTDGRYGADRLAVYLWRLGSYPARPADACPVEGGWTFHPGGIDAPLFHPPATLPPLMAGPVPVPVPAPLTRDALREALREAADAGTGSLPLSVWLDGDTEPVPAAAIGVADLARPRVSAGVRVVVDPERGRLAVAGGAARVRVAYAWGFSGDLGGGPYDRRGSLTPAGAVEWTAAVRAAADGSRPMEFRTLGAALAEWERHAAARPAGARPPTGLIRVLDSARYVEEVHVPPVAGQSLAIEAANGQRPTLAGDLVMRALPAGEVRVNGLYVAGRLHVSGQPRVTLSHCTLRAPGAVPAAPAPAPAPGSGGDAPVLSLRLEHCVSGALLLSGAPAELRASDSILDGDGAAAYAVFERCTVLGRVHAASLQAVDTLFTGGVAVRDRTGGGVACCYLGPDSLPPATVEACQPSPAAPGARPVFVSTRFGDPGYAQLSTATPAAVRAGASDGSEMGAFASLRNPQREANLRAALDEYLPAGMRAAVLYAT